MSAESPIIDWKVFCRLMKTARVAYGFARGSNLADAIKIKTGLLVSERTIYNVESGSQSASVDLFLAMQQVMPDLFTAEYLRPAFRKNAESFSYFVVNFSDE